MKSKRRKPRPQPPKKFFTDNDNCWFCKNKSNCSGCKILKEAVFEQNLKYKKGKINIYEEECL